MMTVEYLFSPISGEFMGERQVPRFVVPTGCNTPEYLNPFENEVNFLDTLPKDDAMRAQLLGSYLQMGIVDPHWVQDHIPEVAEDVEALRQRMRQVRDRAVASHVQSGAAFQEAAPPPQKAEGDPTATGPQSPDSDAQTRQAQATAGQREVGFNGGNRG